MKFNNIFIYRFKKKYIYLYIVRWIFIYSNVYTHTHNDISFETIDLYICILNDEKKIEKKE